jgi:hypothetical protein
MGRLKLAWRVLFDHPFARAVANLAQGGAAAIDIAARSGPVNAPSPTAPSAVPATGVPASGAASVATAAPRMPPPAARSEALTLLETLQRDGRLIDFLRERLDGYSDAQIGAAVRAVHRDCAAVLNRLFTIRPIVDQPEGSRVELTESLDAGRVRLTGNVTGKRPDHGQLVHPGWEITRTELPQWTGSSASANVLAPAEVELRD